MYVVSATLIYISSAAHSVSCHLYTINSCRCGIRELWGESATQGDVEHDWGGQFLVHL